MLNKCTQLAEVDKTDRPLLGVTGLVGPFPDMPYASAMKFLVFSNIASGLSQPCSINSPKWGGSSEAINVQALAGSVHNYQDCLPDFLLYDTDTLNRQAYSESITCPLVKWMNPDPSAAVRTSHKSIAGHQLSVSHHACMHDPQ